MHEDAASPTPAEGAEDEAEALPGNGWDPEVLLDAYAQLTAEHREIKRQLDELKSALVDVARAEGLDEVHSARGTMSFKRWRGLKVASKDVVVHVLERHGLLSEFVTLRTDKLFALAAASPDLREELGGSVEEEERITPRFKAAGGR